MALPKSYNDITISQFQECYFLLGKNPEIEQWISVLSTLSGVPEDWYYNIPRDKLKRKIFRLQFLLNPELNTKVKKFIYLNGTIYKAVYKINELTTAQGIDIKEFQKPEPGQSVQDRIVENADKLLASIYLPLTWKGFKYSVSKHQKASEDFGKAKMGDVYGTLFFYSLVYENLMKATEDCGQKNLDLINIHMKEVIEWARNNPSEITGDGKSPSMN